MNTFVIGFGHRARHGKDTAIQAIIDARGVQYDVRRYAFGDELKLEVTAAITEQYQKMSGFDPSYTGDDPVIGAIDPKYAVGAVCEWAHGQPGGEFVYYDPDADMSDPLCPWGKQRTLLQFWGTEYRRKQNRHYWVDRLEKRIEREQPQIALISDVRFRNEYDWIVEKQHGEMVKVERIGFVGENPTHVSESGLDGLRFPYEILVDEGDLPFLTNAAVDVFDRIIAALTPEEIDLEQMRAEVESAVTQ